MQNLTYFHLFFIFLASFIIGISKAGIRGLDAFQVVLMAVVFGSKASTGIVLPLLCVADIMAVLYYKKSVDWKIFFSLMPSMIIGVFAGLFLGQYIDELLFKKIMAGIVIVTLILLFRAEFLKKDSPVPASKAYTYFMGLAAGFTTMIGNLAGAFANIYFLGLCVSKVAFLGTVSWVFLCINLFKVPLQAFVWHNLTLETLKTDLYLFPLVILGFFVGIKLVGKINEDLFRKIVLIMTVLGSIFLLLS
jgi:uncharacterized protein